MSPPYSTANSTCPLLSSPAAINFHKAVVHGLVRKHCVGMSFIHVELVWKFTGAAAILLPSWLCSFLDEHHGDYWSGVVLGSTVYIFTHPLDPGF